MPDNKITGDTGVLSSPFAGFRVGSGLPLGPVPSIFDAALRLLCAGVVITPEDAVATAIKLRQLCYPEIAQREQDREDAIRREESRRLDSRNAALINPRTLEVE